MTQVTQYNRNPNAASDFNTTGYWFGGASQNPEAFQNGSMGRDEHQIRQNLADGMSTAGARQAPQMDPSQQAQFRAMQMQQAQQLQGIASGQQQGAGELAVQRQVANAQAAQQAQARMARGGNAGMANLQASRQQAGIGLAGAGQAQQAALSDQQAAQGQLMGTLNNGRQGDLSMASGNANLQQQNNQLMDQTQLGYNNQLNQLDANELNAQTSMYNGAQQNKGAFGGLVSGVGAAMMMSDERSKTDIADGGDAIDEMLSKLVAKTYKYKDETKYGKGSRAGIMVQDLEKSKYGKAITAEIPGTGMKGFDVAKAVSAALAATARLDSRLRKMESAR